MRDFMVGNIAVGVVIVDGKAGTEAAFSPAEKLTITIEVSQGLEILQRLKSVVTAGGPAVPLFFMTRTDVVQLNLEPTLMPPPATKTNKITTAAEYERREKLWRDPALNALGFASGGAGVAAYAQSLMSKRWAAGDSPDTAYVLFVTKYMANWMGYAVPEHGNVTLCYPWLVDKTPAKDDGTGGFRNSGAGGHGDENLDRIFAHETCHIFGALDEYPASPCKVTDKGGHLQIANVNCANGNPGSVFCLMKDNDQAMCRATVGHLGWVDADQDGVLDAFER